MGRHRARDDEGAEVSARLFECQTETCICQVITPDGASPNHPCGDCKRMNWTIPPNRTVQEWFAFCDARRKAATTAEPK